LQDDRGLKSAFKVARIYSLFQDLIGAQKARRWWIQQCLRPQPGEKVIDIGCGPGDILELLPQVNYFGLDVSEPYILEARRRYGGRGVFLHGDTQACAADERLRGADLVMCLGVLHHLNDTFARLNLKPGGRFVGIEPCLLAHQSRASRWIMARDRGGNIRREDAWRDLLRRVFPEHSTTILTSMIRIPYIHIALTGRKS
jgi:ubiquinone/menaquinone biosynthesis C-methylase UbiE